MNKKLTICVLSLLLGFSTFVQAQRPYDHSVGGTVGSLNGFSYKTLVTDHFAIGTDLGFKFNCVANGNMNLTAHTFELNTNFMYQLNMSEHSFFYIGAGFCLGYNWKLRAQIIDGYVQGWSWRFGRWGYMYHIPVAVPYGRSVDIYYDAGKGGGHAILGFEYADPISPLAISFDFRPGYSAFFSKTESSKLSYVGGFDWSLNFGIRYTF